MGDEVKKRRGGQRFWLACPECGRKVYGVPESLIVSPKRVVVTTSAKPGEKVVVLIDSPSWPGRMWLVGAVTTPKKFCVNWHWRHKHEPAVFRNYKMALAAIKAWWKVIHGYHKAEGSCPA